MQTAYTMMHIHLNMLNWKLSWQHKEGRAKSQAQVVERCCHVRRVHMLTTDTEVQLLTGKGGSTGIGGAATGTSSMVTVGCTAAEAKLL